MTRFIAALCLMLAALGAGAQEAPAPEELLRRVRDAYRSGPVQERIELRFQDGDRTERETIHFGVDASAPLRRLRIDLGETTLYAQAPAPGPGPIEPPGEGDGGHIDVLLASSEQQFVRLPIERLTRAEIARHLPPIGLPQLEWAIGGEFSPHAFLSRSVQWRSVAPGGSGAAGETYRLSGVSRAGVVGLEVDARTWRLRNATYAVDDEQRDATVRLEIHPLEPTPPERWAPDVEGRTRLTSLADLRPSRRPLEPGEAFPSGWLLDVSGEPWPLADAARAPQGTRRWVMLVAFRYDASPEALDRTLLLAEAGVTLAEQIRRALREIGESGARIEVDIRVAPVFDVGTFSRPRLERLADRWRLSSGETALLWMLAPTHTLERLAPGADVALVAIDEEARLVRAVSLDDNADHLDEVLEGFVTAMAVNPGRSGAEPGGGDG